MKRRMITQWSVVGLVLLLALMPVPVQGMGTLNIQTDTVLAEDYNGKIHIQMDGVTLDCAGHTITSSRAGPGPGIKLHKRSGVTIKNCIVTGFEDGIYLDRSFNNTLTDNTAVGNTARGIFLFASSGNTLTGNMADNNGDRGFSLSTGSSGNALTGNLATANGDAGFIVFSSGDNTLTQNTATGSGQGFAILGASSGNILDGNTSYDNAIGFKVFSNDNTITQNTPVALHLTMPFRPNSR